MSEAATRAREIVKRLKGTSLRGAEIGVSIGQTSEALLRNEHLKLIMVDNWKEEALQPFSYLDTRDWHAHQSREEQAAHAAVAKQVTDFAGDRRTLLVMDSVDAAKVVPDRSLDFVFIDADHSIEGCRSDIAAWKDKVKPGGLLCGHDYGNLPGPKIAVDEFVSESGKPLDLGENYTWFVRL